MHIHAIHSMEATLLLQKGRDTDQLIVICIVIVSVVVNGVDTVVIIVIPIIIISVTSLIVACYYICRSLTIWQSARKKPSNGCQVTCSTVTHKLKLNTNILLDNQRGQILQILKPRPHTRLRCTNNRGHFYIHNMVNAVWDVYFHKSYIIIWKLSIMFTSMMIPIKYWLYWW